MELGIFGELKIKFLIMSKIVITDVQLNEIVDKTQQKFKDYFDGVEDEYFRKFSAYVDTRGNTLDNDRFLNPSVYFSKLPSEIQIFFNSEVKKVGVEKQ